MRVAVVSDVHGNLTALEAVIADISAVGADQVVCGGDLVGSGSSPAEVIDRVRSLKWPAIFGNTDEMLWKPQRVAEILGAPHFRRLRDVLVGEIIPWTLTAIGGERVAWLQALPDRWSSGGVAVVHASPGDAWRSPMGNASDAEMERVYGPLGASVVVHGHTHQPFVRPLATFTLANAGSVSLSYDGDMRASYALVAGDGVTIRRVAYDVDQESSRLAAVGHPQAGWIADTLRAAAFVPLPE